MTRFFDYRHDGVHYIVQVRRYRNGFHGNDMSSVYVVQMEDDENGRPVFHAQVCGHPDMAELAKESFDRYVEYATMTLEEKAERRRKSDALKAKIRQRMQHG